MIRDRILIIIFSLLIIAGLIIGIVFLAKKHKNKDKNKPNPSPSPPVFNWTDQNKKDFMDNVLSNFVKVPCVKNDPNFSKMYNDAIVMITQQELIPYLQSKMSYDTLVQTILLNKGDPYWLANMLTACYKEYCSNTYCLNKFPIGVRQLLKLSFICLNQKCDNFDKNFDKYVSEKNIYPWMIFDPQQPDELMDNMMKSVCS